MKSALAVSLMIVLASFAIGLYLYPQLPDRIPSHWNAAGQVNGYMPKFWGLFIMPIISIGLVLLFMLIPRIDPLKANIDKFMKHYERFVLVIIAFMFYIYLITIFWNYNVQFNIMQLLSPAFAVIFFYAGILMENTRRNWFIGIRTPWTLSSDSVWEKTHRLGGKLFKISGLLCLPAIAFSAYAIAFIIVPVMLFSVYLVVYSYIEFKKEGVKEVKKGKK